MFGRAERIFSGQSRKLFCKNRLFAAKDETFIANTYIYDRIKKGRFLGHCDRQIKLGHLDNQIYERVKS